MEFASTTENLHLSRSMGTAFFPESAKWHVPPWSMDMAMTFSDQALCTIMPRWPPFASTTCRRGLSPSVSVGDALGRSPRPVPTEGRPPICQSRPSPRRCSVPGTSPPPPFDFSHGSIHAGSCSRLLGPAPPVYGVANPDEEPTDNEPAQASEGAQDARAPHVGTECRPHHPPSDP